MPYVSVQDVSLFVKVIGQGDPLAIMHGGPGADYTTMWTLRALADEFNLIFYDHRCNGRSVGPQVSTMTWENLTTDADVLRQTLGFDQWAVLGHSFGGMVALEYALRYPDQLSHLILMDTCGDIRWAHEKAPQLLSERGFSPDKVETARRFLTGQIEPNEMMPSLMKLSDAYNYRTSFLQMLKQVLTSPLPKLRPEALIYCAQHLLKGWTVMDRLSEIKTPTLLIAGRHDFQFPPEHQDQLAAGIPRSQLVIVEEAGHNPHMEQTPVVVDAIRKFLG